MCVHTVRPSCVLRGEREEEEDGTVVIYVSRVVAWFIFAGGKKCIKVK